MHSREIVKSQIQEQYDMACEQAKKHNVEVSFKLWGITYTVSPIPTNDEQ